MSQSKFLKLNKDILLEWVYNANIVKDDYQILYNIKEKNRSYLGTNTVNNISNTYFTIDSVLNKYSKVDTNKYNFLQTKDYDGYNIKYDYVKIYLPIGYTFDDYLGFLMNIYVYDEIGKNTYNISNFLYNKNDASLLNITTNSFFYDERQWQNYILIEIPSISEISLERYFNNITEGATNIPSTEPIEDTINSNLVPKEGRGVNQTYPIFIDFSFLVKEETVFNHTYYYGSDIYQTSVSKTAEYSKLSCSIKESENGDFFEICGLYDGHRSGFENFIHDRYLMGRRFHVEYEVKLYEENILQSTQKFLVTENFMKPIYYRPVIIFSNTTAMIDVDMKLIDDTDGSVILKKSSLGLTKNINKYGTKLTSINIQHAIKPKIYNLKTTSNLLDSSAGGGNLNGMEGIYNNFSNFSSVNVTKVNYPMLYENMFILAKNTNSKNNKYKSSGLLEILISPFNTTFKFNIAKGYKEKNNIEPLNLSELLINSKLKLTFKSDEYILQKDIFFESNDNDLENGIVIFVVNSEDVNIIKKINENNNNFYLTIDGEYSETKTLLYSGKFYLYDDVNFIKHKEINENGENSSFIEDLVNKEESTIEYEGSNAISTSPIINNTTGSSEKITEKILAFIDPIYKVSFEKELFKAINKAKQLHTAYNNTYLIMNVDKKTIAEVEKIKGLDKIVTFK